jgi:putative FmdB family regulatory protein
MPIYEYECLGCGEQFEYLVLPTSAAAACPSCKSKKLKQLLSMFAVSSQTTREANLKAAKKKGYEVQREKAHEDHKYVHREMAEHYHPPEPKKKKK